MLIWVRVSVRVRIRVSARASSSVGSRLSLMCSIAPTAPQRRWPCQHRLHSHAKKELETTSWCLEV